MSDRERITRLFQAMEGEPSEAELGDLLGLVYDELRKLAQHQMKAENRGHTLQPTALVHEAFLRLKGDFGTFTSRAHFFGAAAEAMRRVLLSQARARNALKRGGDRDRVTFQDLAVESEQPDLDVIALDEALSALETQEARVAQVVKMRFFVGFSVDETSELLGVSRATVKRDWSYARAWLQDYMNESADSES